MWVREVCDGGCVGGARGTTWMWVDGVDGWGVDRLLLGGRWMMEAGQ